MKKIDTFTIAIALLLLVVSGGCGSNTPNNAGQQKEIEQESPVRVGREDEAAKRVEQEKQAQILVYKTLDEVSVKYFREGKYQEALIGFRLLAEEGKKNVPFFKEIGLNPAESCYLAGMCCMKTDNIPLSEGMMFFLAGAKMGHSQSQYSLATGYYGFYLITRDKRDLDQAVSWMETYSKHGVQEAREARETMSKWKP